MFDQPCLFIEGSIRMHGNKFMNYKVKHFYKEKEMLYSIFKKTCALEVIPVNEKLGRTRQRNNHSFSVNMIV